MLSVSIPFGARKPQIRRTSDDRRRVVEVVPARRLEEPVPRVRHDVDLALRRAARQHDPRLPPKRPWGPSRP